MELPNLVYLVIFWCCIDRIIMIESYYSKVVLMYPATVCNLPRPLPTAGKTNSGSRAARSVPRNDLTIP